MNGTAPATITAGQMKELNAALAQAIPTDLPSANAEFWKGKKGLLGRKVRDILLLVDPISELLAIQQQRYFDAFGVELDFSSVRVPPALPGFSRLIVMVEGFGPNRYYEACEKKFPCWKLTQDLDEAVKGRNEREWNKTYAIWAIARREADEELNNLSACQIKERGIQTQTLAERLWFGLDWWLEKHQHLDVNNITYCTGSRCSVGGVPLVSWYNDKMRVDWYGPRNAGPGLRARAVVSCLP